MDAIDSVYAQTYSNWEIILVDDASTDNSHELYRQLERDSRIHIFYNNENKGCGYTKRRCAELSNGEICGFLDPDDMLSKEALQIMTKVHVENENISMCYSDMYFCDENLNVISKSQRKPIPDNTTFLEYYNYVSHFAVFKRNFYMKTEGINASIKRAVDHDLYFKLEETGPFCFVPLPLYYYRTGTCQNISCGDNAIKAQFWSYVGMIDACRRRGLDIETVVIPRFLGVISNNEMKVRAVYNSFTYKFGNLILTPFKKIRKLVNNE